MRTKTSLTDQKISSGLTLFPFDLIKELDYDKLLTYCARYAAGIITKNHLLNPKFSTDKHWIEKEMTVVEELKNLNHVHNLQLEDFSDLETVFKILQTAYYSLSLEDFELLSILLRNGMAVQQFFSSSDLQPSSPLISFSLEKFGLSEWIRQIDHVIEPNVGVRDQASEELFRIRQERKLREGQILSQFKRIVTSYKQQSLLADSLESIKNGKLVLAVLAENKRKIKGLFHGYSDSGKIIYIEPIEISNLYQEIEILRMEEEDEIRKILLILTDFFRGQLDQLVDLYSKILQVDLWNAKAKFADLFGAHKVDIVQDQIELNNGFHPLLFIKNSLVNKKVVPFHLRLDDHNRILIISGPNAGGKSIILKSIALFQLMLQSGFLIPVDRGSRMRLFDKICADIGDHQSVDNELSTYSAKLVFMRNFIDQAGPNTMVLIDEFGTGTEPKIGGAIAESVLLELNSRLVYGVMNTHYGNIKSCAYKTAGLINGAMLFNDQALKPTYKLILGRPGSSYALEVAKNSKLQQSVIQKAKHLAGKSNVQFEELLSDLEQKKLELDADARKLKQKEKSLDQLMKQYKELHHQLEIRKLKLRAEIKQQEIHTLHSQKKDIQHQYKDMLSLKNELELKQMMEQKKLDEERKLQEFNHIQHQLKELTKKKKLLPEDFEPGLAVRLIQFNLVGLVSKIDKTKIHVEANNIVFKCTPDELELVNNMVDTKNQYSVQLTGLTVDPTFNSTLDIRGFRTPEAIDTIELFIDRAILSNFKQIKILHGKGSGGLRATVSKELKKYKVIDQFWHPEEGEGGNGITLATFKE